MSNNPTPLSADELAELEEYLMSDQTPDACMDVSTLDGFLTCILSCPQRPEPEEWINWVWDTEAAEEEPSFSSQEQSDHIFALIARHAAALDDALARASDDYEPVFFFQDEDAQIPALDEWCIGYMIAMADYYDQWQTLLENSPVLFEVIRQFGTEDGQEEIGPQLDAMDEADLGEFMQAQARAVRESALAIYKATRG
jgi:uncharacterized protein